LKILIGVDGSPYSKAAVERLATFPVPKDAEVLIVSAAPTAALAYAVGEPPAASYAPQLFEDELKLHQEIATRFERQVREHGFKTRSIVQQGDPRQVLIDTAKNERVNLIVVGSHGRTGMTKLIMGSVANHVVTHAPCDVLVVKLPGK